MVGVSRKYRLTDKVNKVGIKKYENRYYEKAIDILAKKVESRMSKKDLFIKDKLIQWKNQGRIKFTSNEDVIREVKKLKGENYNAYYCQMNLIDRLFDNDEFTFPIDKNGNRIYTNFSNLKKDLRKFIIFDDDSLVELDIKNSQFQFLTIYLQNEYTKESSNKDAKMFYNLCITGMLYDDMEKCLRVRNEKGLFMGRNEFKKLALNWLYAENYQAYTKDEKVQ